MKWHLSIQNKIYLLGAIASLGLIVFLILVYAGKLELYFSQRAVVAQVCLTGINLSLVHELQKERGRSAGYLAKPTHENFELLTAQQAVTDNLLRDFAAFPGVKMPLLEELLVMRQQIAAVGVSGTEAIAFYSKTNEMLLDNLWRLVSLAQSPAVKDYLLALVHLAFAKEYLGQVRAELNMALSRGYIDGGASHNISSLNVLLQSHIRQFHRISPEEIMPVFESVMTDSSVRAVMSIAEQTGRPQREMAVMPASFWFSLSTEAINLFREAEQVVRSTVEKKIELQTSELKREVAVYALILIIAVCITLLSAGYIIKSILRPLDSLLSGISEITRSRNVAQRIAIEEPDEIGVISRGFNELLCTVENLMQEKDRLARTDGLSGVANRLYFSEMLKRQIAGMKRHPGQFSLILFDIDHFKQINDTFGHQTGDNVLKLMAQQVASAFREADIFARWGGEEFVVLMPDEPADAALKLAERLRVIFQSCEFPQAGRVTASFGVTQWRSEEDTAENLFKRADDALYRAKQQGRNRVVVELG